MPLALPGIATGIILSFAHTMGEFGVVLMVGGNIAGVTRTVSISIYDQVQALNYGKRRAPDFAFPPGILVHGAGGHVLATTANVAGLAGSPWPLS